MCPQNRSCADGHPELVKKMVFGKPCEIELQK
jgi:hypothetical protein